MTKDVVEKRLRFIGLTLTLTTFTKTFKNMGPVDDVQPEGLTKRFGHAYAWLEELLSTDFCLTAWQMALATTAFPEAVLTSPNANMCSILSSLWMNLDTN